MVDMADDDKVVRLEVDASSLKPAFDNIAQGFDSHGKAIRSLRHGQAVLGLALFTTDICVIVLAFLR